MAKAFDLRKQLKLHDKSLLQRLFRKNPAMADVQWDSLGAHEVNPIVEAWEAMGEDRQHYQVILQDVNELSDPRGQKVLIEEMEWQKPDRLTAMQALKSPADRALWAYLNVRSIFDQAAIFARAESLRNGQLANRWNSLPKQPLVVTAPILTALENEVRDYYWKKELRGQVCKVHHYSRHGGAEFFFAYLPDWPDKQLIFDQDENLSPREESYAFSNVFVFEPSNGVLELIAKGGQKVQLPLRKAFCRAVLGIDVDDDAPLRASYQLDHLLDPAFSFTTDPADQISVVRLRHLRLVPKLAVVGMESFEPRFHDRVTHAEINVAIGRLLSAFKLDRSQVSVTQASIQVQFMGEGERKGRKMTFHVNCPNTCDLKSKPDDMSAIGGRCIRKWGIVND